MKSEDILILAIISFIIIPLIFIGVCFFAGWSKLKGFYVGMVAGVIYAIVIYLAQRYNLIKSSY